jgi:hypothetical protein
MAPMGMNNWLVLDDGEEADGSIIAFRWGEVCEQHYRLGETVWWTDGARPDEAAGEHLVPGLANGAPLDEADRRGFLPVYYLVRIIDDLIVAAEPVDERRFAEAEAILIARGIPQ